MDNRAFQTGMTSPSQGSSLLGENASETLDMGKYPIQNVRKLLKKTSPMFIYLFYLYKPLNILYIKYMNVPVYYRKLKHTIKYIYITEIKQIGKYLNNFDIKIYISNKKLIPRTTVFKLQ